MQIGDHDTTGPEGDGSDPSNRRSMAAPT
jgi:hypothetical protein